MSGPPAMDLTGQQFGRLLVVVRAPNRPHRAGAMWWCLCSCGELARVAAWNLRNGNTQSCGCRHREVMSEWMREEKTTHGHTTRGAPSPTYNSWRGMIERCTNPKNQGWKNYGGRGITVCRRWHTFENFLADMGERPPGKTIDRKDNDKGYEPGNCHWATAKEQAANKRRRVAA